MREIVGRFLEYIIHDLIFPLEYQEYIGEGKDFWCLDWWAIEIAKYFFEGEIDYLRFPIAKRLEGNNNFRKDDIVVLGRRKIITLGNIQKISDKKGYKEVLVFETCRGFDTTLVNTVQEWDKIFVTIENKSKAVIEKTTEYLKDFPMVEVIDGITFDPTDRPLTWMKTAIFQGGFKI